MNDDDGDGDDDPPGKQAVERDNFDVDPLRLLHVVVDSDMMRTTHNLDWCSLDHSPKR